MGGQVMVMGAQRIEPAERQFRAVARELEQAIWQLLLQPSVGPARVLQLGAVVELLPNVYVQAVRLAEQEPADRYVRVWCVVPTADGETDERTLLCFYTPGFPDPQYTQIRPGMDLNLAWWDAIRLRIAEIGEEVRASSGIVPPAGEGTVLLARTADTGIAGTPPIPAPAQVLISAAAPAVPPLTAAHPVSPRGTTAPPAQSDPRSKERVLQEAEMLFQDVKRAREESYARRDQVEQRLTELYFTLHPYMRQAMQHATELSVGALIDRWVREGCPAPAPAPPTPLAQSSLSAPLSPPPISGLPAPTPMPTPTTLTPLPVTTGGPMATADGHASGTVDAHPNGTAPWPLALELESTKAVIAEQTRELERLCELSGGHMPLPRRDPTTGRLMTACERCDAQLAMRAPDQHDTWLH